MIRLAPCLLVFLTAAVGLSEYSGSRSRSYPPYALPPSSAFSSLFAEPQALSLPRHTRPSQRGSSSSSSSPSSSSSSASSASQQLQLPPASLAQHSRDLSSRHSLPSEELQSLRLPASPLADEQEEVEEREDEVPSLSGSRNCSRCVLQEEARSRRLEEVKLEILRKLGLTQAPNVTVRDLPRIPPLQNLLGDDLTDDYLSEHFDGELMASDMPASPSLHQQRTHQQQQQRQRTSSSFSRSPLASAHEYEDFYVNTEKSISFAKPREFLPTLSFACLVS